MFELKRLVVLHKYTWCLVGQVVNRQLCCLYSGQFGEELHSHFLQLGNSNGQGEPSQLKENGY